MNKDDKVKFTPEGFKEVEDALTFLPEEKRHAMMILVCNQLLA